MSATIHTLPTAATSYYQISTSGGFWRLYLVTPSSPRPLRTKLASFPSFESAKAYAEPIATKAKRRLLFGKGLDLGNDGGHAA